ncbi:putative membrane protein [Brucella pseudogrignonensis]|uniref:Putative membrane protein n=1 Tax=Brucella pseudogrignonensis TaxID=419475 RepID=A0A256G908_9HYPH|nr:putative membrane protein [Brucella pseudogrignonensis]
MRPLRADPLRGADKKTVVNISMSSLLLCLYFYVYLYLG